MPRRRASRVLALSSFPAAIAAVLVTWAVWPAPRRPPLAGKPIHDDLRMPAATIDAAALLEGPPCDRLVAGAGGAYLWRASDHAIVNVARAGAKPRVLMTLDAGVAGMALGPGTLWLSVPDLPQEPPQADAGRRRHATRARGALVKVALPNDDAGMSGDRRKAADAGASWVVASEIAGRPGAVVASAEAAFVVAVESAPGDGLLHKSAILRIPAAGGDATVLGRSAAEITDLALDETNVYWIDSVEETLLTAPQSGGSPRVLAADRPTAEQLTVANGAVFWVAHETDTLWTMPVGGGKPREVTHDIAGFALLAADAHRVAWINIEAVDGAYRVLAIPAAGGDVVALTPDEHAIDTLATDGEHLLWSRDGAVSWMDAGGDAATAH